MPFLPRIQGRFPVGLTTFVTPVNPSRPIGSARLRNNIRGRAKDCPDHAFILEEVAFSLYYPADINAATSKKGVPWFIRPIQESLRGFAAFSGLPSWLLWPIAYFFAILLKIPVYPNASLLSPSKANSSSKDLLGTVPAQWPLVIFSHGLGGTRTMYSQYCSRLAASGRVVIAIEHREGTGAMCMTRSWNREGKSELRTLFYLKENDIHWGEDDSMRGHPLPLRSEQLVFRHHEVHIAYSTFCRFIRNDPNLELETIDGLTYDKQSWTTPDESVGERVKYNEDVVLTGHSFGGCTVLSLLSTRPLDGYSPIPISRAIILDPWLEPIPSPGPIPFSKHIPPNEVKLAPESVDTPLARTMTELPHLNGKADTRSSHPRILVINSETFTLWKDHFTRLQKVVSAWEPGGGRILTIVGSEHAFFSDLYVLPGIGKKAARLILDTVSNLSLAFLNDELDEAVQQISITKMETKVIGVKKDGKPKRKLVGNVGDVIVQYN
ncbi:hypothetical protein BYT27DRAFT_7132610 [Phlegmacium glaucopus]|nr:hypothetical protein BYT27DRAFT_7132610 [Phlegmacium glaucopus]